MASNGKFGRTWWGQQWLNALTNIDYDNRLPRGRAYANKGAVEEITLDENRVIASVAGSRPNPYQVELSLPRIPDEKLDQLLDGLVKQPIVLSKMLNRELDPTILSSCEQLGISIFPAKWNDLGMSCSCPDWAIPCKHIAAVIYLLSQEIDGNPFTVFSLRGIDLTGELKNRGVSIVTEAKAELPKIADLLNPNNYNHAIFNHELLRDDDTSSLDRYLDLDYSQLTDLKESLVALLPPDPPFHGPGNFRTQYLKMITKLEKNSKLILDIQPCTNEDILVIKSDFKPVIEISTSYDPQVLNSGNIISLSELLRALRKISQEDLANFQPETAAFFNLQMACLHLIAHGAIVPEIYKGDNFDTRIRWLPALIDPSVSNIVSQIAKLIPLNLLVLNNIGDTQSSASHSALTLCSLILDELVSELSEFDSEPHNQSNILNLFFRTRRANFTGPGQNEIASGINMWLSCFRIGHAGVIPLLWLNESSQGISLSLWVERREISDSEPIPLAEVLNSDSWQDLRYSILQKTALITNYFEPLSQYVSLGADDPIWISPDELYNFLFDVLPIIKLLGVRAILPKELARILKPKLTVKIATKNEPTASYFNFADLLNFDWRIAVGDSLLSRTEFEELVRSAHGIVKFRGEYVYLDPKEIERLRNQLEKNNSLTGRELLSIALANEYIDGTPISIDKSVKTLIKTLTTDIDLEEPSTLVANLRPYQRRGYEWLYKNVRSGFGSVIADDMGLGKTVQVISLLLKLKEEGQLDENKALIVVPTSLLTNWSKEIEKFAPSLSYKIFHGSQRRLDEIPDVVLTSYGVVRTDLAVLKKHHWKLRIIDEAQNIKNQSAAQTKSVKSIPASASIAMTGTPVENRLSEYWSIMDFANNGLLGSAKNFSNKFATPIQKNHDHEVAMRFKRITSPFLLRRVKSDKSIISDLPEKIEQNYLCDLTEDQASIYESVVREALASIDGESDLFKRQGVVLQMILALKQICNHPAQFLKSGDSAFARSGKAEMLLDLLEPIYENHEKVLIFTQFREAGELISGWINDKFSHEPQFLHGGLSRKRRDEMVHKFQTDPTERSFILSLKAGGTGLNLTAATYVVHFDLWWNPAVEQQATDRAYRIGQNRMVSVYRLITKNTFEERINEMITAKRELAELSVGAGENWIGNLNNKELRDVFSLT